MEQETKQMSSAVFITFAGNCKKALSFYQNCFGGKLQFENFDKELPGFPEMPVVSGSLVADSLVIHGSDLVHNEGRKLGNYIAIFLKCKSINERKIFIKKLSADKQNILSKSEQNQSLIEITDQFDVRWIFGI